VRKSASGKSIHLDVAVFLYDDGSIHITANDIPGFHVAVNADPKRVNGHPTLFKRLAQCLREAGAPAPPEQLTD